MYIPLFSTYLHADDIDELQHLQTNLKHYLKTMMISVKINTSTDAQLKELKNGPSLIGNALEESEI